MRYSLVVYAAGTDPHASDRAWLNLKQQELKTLYLAQCARIEDGLRIRCYRHPTPWSIHEFRNVNRGSAVVLETRETSIDDPMTALKSLARRAVRS